MTRIYLALGSNLANPLNQVQSALQALATIPDTTLVAKSSLYRTSPYGPSEQPDFLNAAVALDSTLEAEVLLDHTQKIELVQGRVHKGHRWGPRVLDIDIMLFGRLILRTPRLTVPHYDMHNRAFMLLPLLEIMPNLHLPDGTSLAQVLAKLDTDTIHFW